MKQKTDESLSAWIDAAVSGDKAAIESVIGSVQNLVFNLSLRMLGTFPDAEDASQDILLKVVTHLSSFKGESAFSTWVFRIAINHLVHYKKHMFAKFPLDFAFYANDIEHAPIENIPDMTQNVDRALLAEELKLACTNVLLQCLDAQSRAIFILGAMFHLDSRVAGEMLELSPEAYRQRFSRARRKVADFLHAYCGEYGCGRCQCSKRVDYAIQSHRLHPQQRSFTSAVEIPAQAMLDVKNAMEEIDGISQEFSFCKAYESPDRLKQLIRDFLDSPSLRTVQQRP